MFLITRFFNKIHIFPFQKILHLFLLIRRKKHIIIRKLRTGGLSPPPVYGHARNYFFTASLSKMYLLAHHSLRRQYIDKSLGFLKVHDLIEYQSSCFMYKYFNNKYTRDAIENNSNWAKKVGIFFGKYCFRTSKNIHRQNLKYKIPPFSHSSCSRSRG